MLKIINVVGARPNFMKVAPLHEAMMRRGDEFTPFLLHTGQHFDREMSQAFFHDLGLPRPDSYLGVGSGTHAMQTAAVMQKFEPVVLAENPDWVVVVGDVNSTLACALVCAKLDVRVAHVEAGLRSRDRGMPEEINRVLTDQIADLLLTPSEDADANLLAEGISHERIRFVGNIMIDSLFAQIRRAGDSRIREDLGLEGQDYAVVTLHRPSNVDEPVAFSGILSALHAISERLPVVFPVHPRTRGRISEFGFGKRIETSANLKLIDPLGYLDFLRLYSGARLVLTDSGGIQEETTALSIPCLTLRENTERPITVEMGTNHVVGTKPENILKAAYRELESPAGRGMRRLPPLWDGRTAERILNALVEHSTSLEPAGCEVTALT